jgi:glycosyltransferase involved in cell wall biosynthesis
MKSALICVDNLRVGGFQRLALDESYALSDVGYKVVIASLEYPKLAPGNQQYFTEIEASLIQEKAITVKYLNRNYLSLLKETRQIVKSSSCVPLIISHSLRTTFVLRINRLLNPKHSYVINTKIHQIPSLIDKKQRIKRLVFSQFADNLYCFSSAVLSTWRSQFAFSKYVPFQNRIELLRNGVYLPRLPEVLKNPPPHTSPKLVFLGRLTFWKGVDVIEGLASSPDLQDFDFLFVVPNYDEKYLGRLRELLGSRMSVLVGKSPASLKLQHGDLHLYPTQYGDQSLVTESVSLNCLEMAGVGIPSLVTLGGQVTWKEDVFNNVFIEVDWKDKETVVKEIIRASKIRVSENDLNMIRQSIDISNEIRGYLP